LNKTDENEQNEHNLGVHLLTHATTSPTALKKIKAEQKHHNSDLGAAY
jgi:hypothetical protein